MFIAHYEHQIKLGRMDPAIDDMPHYVDRAGQAKKSAATVLLQNYSVRAAPAIGDHRFRDDGTVEIFVHQVPAPRPTFYIAGPMRGYAESNFPAFDAARDRGRAMGFGIISPADLDRAKGFKATDKISDGMLREIIERDVKAIMSLDPAKGDGVAVLDDWDTSKGATAEVLLARWRGLKIVWAVDFETVIDPIVMEDLE
jgi:hypothetical protein